MPETQQNQQQQQPLIDGIRDLVFEASQFRMTHRSGWHHILIAPESVAEHCHRGSILAFLVASLAKSNEAEYSAVDPSYVSTLFVFHEMTEARAGDDDAIQKKYITIDTDKILKDQTVALGDIGEVIKNMWQEVDQRLTPSGRLAKDCDYLEMAFTARELVVQGNPEAQKWIDAAGSKLVSQTAKDIFNTLNQADPFDWWKKALGYPSGH